MSNMSCGKFCLADEIMMQHFRCKNGSDTKEDLEKSTVLYSDEYECFLEFKKATGGVIYQHKEVEINKCNQQMIADLDPEHFKIIEIKEEGKRKKYEYEYFNVRYKTLKELNKKKVYIRVPIYFDTLLDIIPYYHYIPTMIGSDTDENGERKLTVYISKEDYLTETRNSFLRSGISSWNEIYQRYKKRLQEHYIDVINRYYTPKSENHKFELVKFDENRLGRLNNRIDDRFPVKWFFVDGDKNHPRWCEPKVIDYEKGIIEISPSDYEHFIGKECYVNYYIYEKPKLYLN